jgi:hypothetical protein
MSSAKPAPGRRLAGVIGFYPTAPSIVEGMKKVREANYENFDAYTPFPVHGLEHAQGLRRSPLPYVTFVAGLAGCTLGFLLEYWTSAVDWPLIIGGKPFNSWPAFVPIMFECTVLFAGLATAGAMLAINGLPNIKRKAYHPAIARDRFAIVVEAPLPVDEDDEEALDARRRQGAGYKAFSEAEVADFLKRTGATEVRSVYAEGWF